MSIDHEKRHLDPGLDTNKRSLSDFFSDDISDDFFNTVNTFDHHGGFGDQSLDNDIWNLFTNDVGGQQQFGFGGDMGADIFDRPPGGSWSSTVTFNDGENPTVTYTDGENLAGFWDTWGVNTDPHEDDWEDVFNTWNTIYPQRPVHTSTTGQL